MLSATVIVPTYNRPDALARTLDALLAMDFPRDLYEIVVVDTGRHTLGAEEIVGSRRIRYLRQPDLGVAAARNCGAALATGELLLFVDDDTVVEKSTLTRHETIHRDHERCLVYGHRELDPSVRSILQTTPLGRYRLAYEDRYNKPAGVGGVNGHGRVYPQTLAAGNLSMRRELFELLGGFDARFPVGAEDQDLTWRAHRAGCTLIYDYEIRAIHNDQHRDLMDLCRRVERAAVGTVYFCRKNLDAPQAAMLDLNGPIAVGDRPRLIARKVIRTLLSQPVPLLVVKRTVRVAEKLMPGGGPVLEWLYNAQDGLYVFRGVRRGLRMTAEVSWPPAHEATLAADR